MKFIYFSPVTWSSFAQRPHAMVRHFLRRGGKEVLWIDPYPTRLPKVGDLWRDLRLHKQGTPPVPGVRVIRPGGLPVEPLPGGAWLNGRLYWQDVRRQIAEFVRDNSDITVGVGRPSALALEVLGDLERCASFYDAMDDFPYFYGGLSRLSMQRREAAISESVDRIYVSSLALAQKFSNKSRHVVLVPNACEMASLPLARTAEYGARFTIGYVGTIAAWFDWSVVVSIARAVPEAMILLVGPCFSRPPTKLPPNIQLRGPCRLDEIPAYLERFSLGMIPFRVYPLTESVDPIKYYEYRAMGLPILTTGFGEMRKRDTRDGVFEVKKDSDLRSIVMEAARWQPRRGEVEEFRRSNDWESRFSSIPVLFGRSLRPALSPHYPCRSASKEAAN